MSVSGTHVFECAGKQVSAQQHPDAFTFFDKFLSAYPVDRIIEIGTAAGGLAWWLRHRVSVPITTYDIVEHPLHADLRAAGVDVVRGSVFDDTHRAQIEAALQAPGCVLLLCDGGNKVQEFNHFAAYLKPGDVIMAHDYSADRTTYRGWSQAKWPWWEIRWADVAAACERAGLVVADAESEAALWLSMRKP
jgi:hypothetical protein